MGTVPPTETASPPQGEAPESTDFANYFCTYAFLYHQKDMLEDRKRTGAYYDAVMKNQQLFRDRVVLDVGTGSGILALFAAKAGARRVYAVEATDMARHARTLMQANQVGEKVVVIEGTMESVELPEKVDVIISEWMGYFLLRESMLDSVLEARDKFLKPGGSLFPSHANMYLAPISSAANYKRQQEYERAMSSWHGFGREMQEYYGVDVRCLTKSYDKEQREYYRCTAQWSEVHPQELLAQPVCFKSFDLLTVTLEELKVKSGCDVTALRVVQVPLEAEMKFHPFHEGAVEALCGFFDVAFSGSPQNPAHHPVHLSTAPEHGPCTHWGQLSFYLFPPIQCWKERPIPLSLKLTRRGDNHRLMNMEVKIRKRDDQDAEALRYNFFIE